jgi:very-short-patch-repair endonuclease
MRYPEGTIFDQSERLSYVRANSESPIEFKLAHWLSDCHRFVFLPNEHVETFEVRRAEIGFAMQHPVGPYRLDMVFVVRTDDGDVIKVNVECDGAKYHETPSAIARDAKRDDYMRDRGFLVWRYAGWMLHHGSNEVADEIQNALYALRAHDEPILAFIKNRQSTEPTLPEMEAAFYAFWASDVWPNGFGPTPKQRGWEHVTDIIQFMEQAA